MIDDLNENHLPVDLIDRYLAGECTPAEEASVRSWLKADAANRVTLELLNTADSDSAVRNIDVDAALQRALRGPAQTSAPRRRNNYWTGIGATLGAVVIALAGFQYLAPGKSDRDTPSGKTYSAKPGQRASIKLADGSQVTLAPGTTMRVSARTVDLSGEAVFAVVHSEGNPFIVRANGAVTQVLGTTFGVRAYAGDKSVRVAVAEGKVAVNSSVLVAGDAAIVSATGTSVQHEANIANIFAWTSGRLVFDKVKLRDAIPDMERWYGITITADEQLLDRPVVTAFQTETAAEAVRLLSITLGATSSIHGSRVTLTSN